jgi:AcrR family transcriptional regulator
MSRSKEASEAAKKKIMDAASGLFARHGVNGVSIRDIAAEAGMNHALIIRYFGSKDGLVTEILRREISALTGAYSARPEQSAGETLAKLRGVLLNSLTAQQDTMRLILRSGLDGLSPESYVDPNAERAATLMAKWIASRQTNENLPDAKLVSVVVMGTLFSLTAIAPWLMTSVGLPPEDFANRKKDIVDVLIWIMLQAVGAHAASGQPAQDTE